MNTEKELTDTDRLDGIVSARRMRSLSDDQFKYLIEKYGRQQYEAGRQESKWITLNIDLLEIELISATYKVTEEYLFTDGPNVGIGKIKIYHAHDSRFNPGDWWPLVPALNGLPTHYMPKPSAPDQGKESNATGN